MSPLCLAEHMSHGPCPKRRGRAFSHLVRTCCQPGALPSSCPVGLSGPVCALVSQKGLDSNCSSYLQLCDLGQVTFPSLSSFPSSVTSWGSCESLRRKCLDNTTQEPGTGKRSKCASVSSGYCCHQPCFPVRGNDLMRIWFESHL